MNPADQPTAVPAIPVAHNKHGHPIDMDTRGALFKDATYRIVAQHHTTGDDPNAAHDLLISTVWTGLDATYGLAPDAPHIFETGIYGHIAGQAVTIETTHPTLADAEQGHRDALSTARRLVVQAREDTINRDRWITRQVLGDHDPDQTPIPGYTDPDTDTDRKG